MTPNEPPQGWVAVGTRERQENPRLTLPCLVRHARSQVLLAMAERRKNRLRKRRRDDDDDSSSEESEGARNAREVDADAPRRQQAEQQAYLRRLEEQAALVAQGAVRRQRGEQDEFERMQAEAALVARDTTMRRRQRADERQRTLDEEARVVAQDADAARRRRVVEAERQKFADDIAASVLNDVVPRDIQRDAEIDRRRNADLDLDAVFAAQERQRELSAELVARDSDDAAERRARRLGNDTESAVVSASMQAEALQRAERAAREQKVDADIVIATLEFEKRKLQEMVVKLSAELEECAENWRPPPPNCVEQIVKLYEADKLDDERHRLAMALLKGVGRALFAQASNTKKEHVVYGKEERAFYGLLLAYGGHFVVELVANALGGPSVRSVIRWRSKSPRLICGTSDDAIAHNLSCVIEILSQYNLLDFEAILTEDGTAAKKHIDIVKEKDADGKLRIVVYGLGGGLLVSPASVDDVATAAREQGLASNFYAISLVPLVDGAPAIPLVVDANCNDFDAPDVQDVLFSIYRALAKTQLRGKVIGDVSDGDSRLRRFAKQCLLHDGDVAEKYILLDHPLVQMRIPYISGHGWHAQIADWMHIIWRMRTNMLKDEMELIETIRRATFVEVGRTGDLPLNDADLNKHFKQNWLSCEKMANVASDHRNVFILDALADTDAKAETLFCTLMNKYMTLFTDETLSLDARLRRAGFVLHCLASWKQINTAKFKRERLEKRCFTDETYFDIAWSVEVLVLLVKLHREEDKAGWPYERRLSSRFAEYLFAYCSPQCPKSKAGCPLRAMLVIKRTDFLFRHRQIGAPQRRVVRSLRRHGPREPLFAHAPPRARQQRRAARVETRRPARVGAREETDARGDC